MRGALSDPVFRRLFAAQALSLLGIGLLTAALSLAAFRMGGVQQAGLLLGGIFVLKMLAYVLLAPLCEAALAGIARRPALIALDGARLLLLLPLAFVTAWWQVGALTFVFFAASAAFTPLFQALIPTILPGKAAYTEALALSRLASTLETMLSPVLVGLALLLIPAPFLFILAALCFAGSIGFLLAARIDHTLRPKPPRSFLRRAGRGLGIYLRTPRLRGLLAANFGLSLAMAWVLVNTVVYAGARFGDVDTWFPLLMAAFGTGSAVAALALPRVLAHRGEREVVIAGVLAFAALSPLLLLTPPPALLPVLWAGFGAAASLTLAPGGLVLVRSAAEENRPAVFAAQFSLSHAGWLVAYPLAGWLATVLAPPVALALLGCGAGAMALVALRLWPAVELETRLHAHPDLPADHPHLLATAPEGAANRHRHAFHVDDLHPYWNISEGLHP